MGFIKLFHRGSFTFSAYSLVLKKFLFKKYCFSHSLEFFQPYTTKTVYKMNSAYFQFSEEKVLVSVNYNENNIKKILKFQRNIMENMETFLQRVQVKLQDVVTKKLKKKDKGIDHPEILPDLNISLILNNEIVPGEMKFQEIFEEDFDGNLKLRINDIDYSVYLNAPMVMKMTLPPTLYVGTVVFPETLETQYMDEENSEYIWYKSDNPLKIKSWKKCGEGFFYFTQEEDIDHHLKIVCTPKMNEKEGPVFELISNGKIMKFKAFEEIKKRQQFTKDVTKADEFRIVSYNILASTYTQTKEAKTELFTFCDPAFLNFTYRKTLCISELLGYNADIICLQEVDKFHYSTLQLLFSRKNYGCLFDEKEGSREGCTFMFNIKKFNILNSKQYIFSNELFNNPLFDDVKIKIQENENLIARLQGMSTQIQVVVLENKTLKDFLIIGNTHFYFHPDADHIRLLQGILSWRILHNTYEELKNKQPDKKCSIVLCGDLNSTPECGFHQFLNTGFLDSDHIGWKSKEDEAIKDISCQHSLKMKSAYDNTQYTNYTPLFKGCLDYIYYQTDHLTLKQTVPIPSEEVLNRHIGIPSQFFPSDHVALVADFKFEE